MDLGSFRVNPGYQSGIMLLSKLISPRHRQVLNAVSLDYIICKMGWGPVLESNDG